MTASLIPVQVLYFASVRERMGLSSEKVMVPEGAGVSALRQQLCARGEASQQALSVQKGLRVAVNQVMVQDDVSLNAGDEVAFFPPVTGG
jgi:molybdopterin synthase sulfur carrier subunit